MQVVENKNEKWGSSVSLGDIIISSCSMDGYMEYKTTLAMHLVRTLVIDPSACVQQTKLEATIW
jgi:hypothetical protein